jgi:PAT family beta-lactamase induction signal transducer AmpG
MPSFRLRDLKNRRLGAMLFLGFSSGLPLLLTGGTLQAWMTIEKVDLKTIGLFSLVGLPYGFKFLWAPLMDAIVPPWLGRRRGWMLITQLSLLLGVAGLGLCSPKENAPLLAAIAAFVTFAAASQDIVLDAYRTDVLEENERGPGISLWVLGYRLAMLTSGALALILGEHIGWRTSYFIMALLMGVGIVTTWLSEPAQLGHSPPRGFRAAVWEPLHSFLVRRSALTLLLLILLYKLCDSYAASLSTAFLIGGVNFTPTDVAVVNKGVGILATMAGVVCGGVLLVKMGLFRSLVWFGILQAVTNLMFMLLAEVGHDYVILVLTITVEKFAGGMGDVPFVALLMALCDKRFSAFQYALLSSVPAIGRNVIAASAGYVVDATSWSTFFFFTFVSALPGLLLLFFLKEVIHDLSGTEPLVVEDAGVPDPAHEELLEEASNNDPRGDR